MKFMTSYGSSSSGSCYLFVPNDTPPFLIDIGINVTKTISDPNREYLRRVAYLLITHEHSDHTKYLEAFLRFNFIATVIINKLCWNELIKNNPSLIRYESRVVFLGNKKTYKDHFLTFRAFEVQHDSKANNGYQIRYSLEGDTLFFATDIGSLKFKAISRKMLEKTKLIFIESNHVLNKHANDFKTAIQHSDWGHYSHIQAQATLNLLSYDIINKNDVYIHYIHTSESEYLTLCGLDLGYARELMSLEPNAYDACKITRLKPLLPQTIEYKWKKNT